MILPTEASGIVPLALLALDLIDDGDERSVHAGRLLLGRAEATDRRD